MHDAAAIEILSLPLEPPQEQREEIQLATCCSHESGQFPFWVSRAIGIGLACRKGLEHCAV
jgi:hypothetical protein